MTAGSTLVIFRVGDEEMGVPVAMVREVAPWQPPTRIPHAPSGVLGLVNIRGNVVIVIDLRERLSAIVRATQPNALLVVAMPASIVGFAVDEVVDIDRVMDVASPPGGALEHPGMLGVALRGDRVILVIDLRAIAASKLAAKLAASG